MRKSNNYKPSLTSREKELFEYFVRGLSNEDIADLIDLSSNVINSYRIILYHKFGVNNAKKLSIFALKYGLTTLKNKKSV